MADTGETPASGRTLAAALERLPLFPLPGVVLFPHALLPLHIFEERYRKMARDVLSSHRMLAVGLVASGGESDEPAVVEPICGVGEVVMAHELPDGRFNLVVRGRARVRIVRELPSPEPYRLVNAVVVPDKVVGSEREVADAEAVLRALAGQLADAIPEGGDLLRQVVAAQGTPAELADVLAAALVVDPATRQKLLETTNVGKRLERVGAEVVVMTARVGSPRRVN